MKTTITKLLIPFLAFSFLLFSCKKENSNYAAKSTVVETDATVFKSLEGSILKLKLRPNTQNGQDAYVDHLDSDPETGNHNQNYVPELPINKWTVNGDPISTRSYLRFDSLVLIPTNAKLISATLYLYGLSRSLNTPQGNQGDNTCLLQRVVSSNWLESTITWNNQPSTTTTNQVIIPASTSQWNYNVALDVTKLVKGMVANPASNYGFGIKLATEEIYRSIVFASSEAADHGLRPTLIVKYQ